MPKGFLYAEFEKYREKVAAVSASFGGRYVVRRAEPVALDERSCAVADRR
jgi:uncharacterized protein (DUF1330 family)